MITGDIAICSIEDNQADLMISAIDSIRGFHKKTNKTFDEMIVDPQFDKYTKTVLWHSKGNKGSKIAQKYNITRDCVRVSGEDDKVYEVMSDKLSPSAIENILVMKEIASSLDEEESLALNTITKEPKLIKLNGKINYKELGRKLNINRYRAEGLVRRIKNKTGGMI